MPSGYRISNESFSLFSVLGLLCLLVGCGGQSGAAQPDLPTDLDAADQLWLGSAYTLTAEGNWAEALAVKDGRIVYVGDRAGASGFQSSQTEVIELPENSMLLPGLHDVHTHPLETGSENLNCLLHGQDNPDQWLQAIGQCATQGEGWVLGWGFSMGNLVADGRNPRQALDAVANGRPVAIMEETSHAAWVSSAALTELGFTPATANPSGGHIGKDASGELNGLLMDTAGDMAFHKALDGEDAAKSERDYQGLMWALEQIRQHGITSIANARVYWKRGNLKVWQRAVAEGTLSARTVVGLWYYPEDGDDAAQIAELSEMRDSSGPLFRVDEVKLYDDGISINSTAAMHDRYLQDLGYGFLEPNYGINYFSEHRLGQLITQLEAAGFRAHIHTIGDRGVHEALNAIEYAQAQNQGKVTPLRHRLTHVEYVSPADYARFGQLNVTADAQVAGDWTLPSQHSAHEKALLGEARMADQIPLRGLFDNGARITLSSDWNVSTLNPFIGMQHALTRGKQSMPNLHEVLKAYTINAAYALAQDEQVGSLEVGKFADLTVVDRNLFEQAPENLGQTQVLYTVVAGTIVYAKP